MLLKIAEDCVPSVVTLTCISGGVLFHEAREYAAVFMHVDLASAN